MYLAALQITACAYCRSPVGCLAVSSCNNIPALVCLWTYVQHFIIIFSLLFSVPIPSLYLSIPASLCSWSHSIFFSVLCSLPLSLLRLLLLFYDFSHCNDDRNVNGVICCQLTIPFLKATTMRTAISLMLILFLATTKIKQPIWINLLGPIRLQSFQIVTIIYTRQERKKTHTQQNK